MDVLWLISTLSFSPSALKATPFYGICGGYLFADPKGSPILDGGHVVFVISHLLAIASSQENGFLSRDIANGASSSITHVPNSADACISLICYVVQPRDG